MKTHKAMCFTVVIPTLPWKGNDSENQVLWWSVALHLEEGYSGQN